jgi:hypothetical protein
MTFPYFLNYPNKSAIKLEFMIILNLFYFTNLSRFAYGFEFTGILDSAVAKISGSES